MIYISWATTAPSRSLTAQPGPHARVVLSTRPLARPCFANSAQTSSGLIELTHNYGSEDDPDFKIENGNKDPYKGFGHIAISVDNIQAACQRLEDAGYKFQKKLTDGRMKSIAFALDPGA